MENTQNMTKTTPIVDFKDTCRDLIETVQSCLSSSRDGDTKTLQSLLHALVHGLDTLLLRRQAFIQPAAHSRTQFFFYTFFFNGHLYFL